MMQKVARPAVVLAVLTSLALSAASAQALDLASDPCSDVRVPVALVPGGAATESVYGVHCSFATTNGLIQVLVAGATEGGAAYWDFPHPDYYRSDPAIYRPLRARYSYVHYLAERGYASLTIDRIGTGRSSHPPAQAVTIQSNAFVVHQVVEKMRAGTAPFSAAYDTIIGVAHSLGGAVLYVDSVDHAKDFDGLIVAGLRRHQTPRFAEFPTTFVAAQTEPRFAAYPPGYYTTRPGAHAEYFFYAPYAEQSVIDHEERTKETITDGEVATFLPSLEATSEVRVPVLSIVGEHDIFFCSDADCPEASQERDYFPEVACFESQVTPNGAHDLNLQTNAKREVFPLLVDWIERNFGPGRTPCTSA